MRHNAAQPQGGVDWYTPSTTGAAGGYGSYSAPPGAYGGASTSGYGTTDNFEDEPPLLEGAPRPASRDRALRCIVLPMLRLLHSPSRSCLR